MVATENSAPSTPSTPSTADAKPNTAKEKRPVTTTKRSTATTPDFDALIATALAKAVPGIIAAIVPAIDAKIVSAVAQAVQTVAPAAAANAVAEATATAEATAVVVAEAPPAAAPETADAPAPASPTHQEWTGVGYVAKLQDRLTPRGAKELVVRFFPGPNSKCMYPVAYKTTRDAILALDVQVGDKVSMAGFVSVNEGRGEHAGKSFPKLVIRDFAVMSRKADRTAKAVGDDRVLNLNDLGDADLPVPSGASEDEVVPQAPAGEAMKRLLAQVPNAENPF